MNKASNKRFALVTGSTAGIGKAIALALANSGYTVFLNGRTKTERSDAALKEIHSICADAQYLAADVSDHTQVEILHKEIVRHTNTLDVLVNNAGLTEPSTIKNFDMGRWKAQFEVNFFSAVYVTHAFLGMLQNAGGSILNVSSIRGLFECGREGVMAYSAAKAALNSLTTTLAKDLAPTIRVNAILPGFTATSAPFLEQATPEQIALWSGLSKIKRLIEPSEIADLAVSMVKNQALTGSLVVADGGFTLRPD